MTDESDESRAGDVLTSRPELKFTKTELQQAVNGGKIVHAEASQVYKTQRPMQFTADSLKGALKRAATSAMRHTSDGMESAKQTMAKTVGLQLNGVAKRNLGGEGVSR